MEARGGEEAARLRDGGTALRVKRGNEAPSASAERKSLSRSGCRRHVGREQGAMRAPKGAQTGGGRGVKGGGCSLAGRAGLLTGRG